MFSKIKLVPLIICLGIVAVVEVANYLLFPAIHSVRLRHVDEMDNVAFVFFLSLLVAAVILILNLYKNKYPGADFPLVLVVASLLHVNYLIWTIECCPGG